MFPLISNYQGEQMNILCLPFIFTKSEKNVFKLEPKISISYQILFTFKQIIKIALVIFLSSFYLNGLESNSTELLPYSFYWQR